VSKLQPRLVGRSCEPPSASREFAHVDLKQILSKSIPLLEVLFYPGIFNMAAFPHTILRDDFKLSTLLYTGAFLQALLFIAYPYRVVALPVVLTIAGLVTKNMLIRFNFLHNPSLDKVNRRRTTAQIVNDDGSVPENGCDKEIVVFLVGSCTNK
jgi:hypothetical protein